MFVRNSGYDNSRNKCLCLSNLLNGTSVDIIHHFGSKCRCVRSTSEVGYYEGF